MKMLQKKLMKFSGYAISQQDKPINQENIN